MSNYDNIVISSRVRLARNFSFLNFPAKLTDYDEALSIVKGIYEVLSSYGDFDFYKMKNIQNLKSLILLEENLISKELLENKDISSVAISEKDSLSVMINEEDHIREQCVLGGFNLQQAFERVDALDDILLENFSISYDEKLGFLTASPTNLGTGMRASVMLFLPALTMMGKIESLSSSANKLGLTVRGKYGENSSGEGYMYQISNEQCLGFDEEQIIQNVINVTVKICEMEEEFLQEIMKEKGDEIIDLVKRSYGTLLHAYMISAKESIKLLSHLKLGVNLGIIKLKNKKIIDELMTKSQPAHLMELSAKDLNIRQRDIYRAEYISKILQEETK